MILPIEKYKLINQAYLARRRCWCQNVRIFFSLQEKGTKTKMMNAIKRTTFKVWKKIRLEMDLNPWPLPYQHSVLPTELSSQLGAGHVLSR